MLRTPWAFLIAVLVLSAVILKAGAVSTEPSREAFLEDAPLIDSASNKSAIPAKTAISVALQVRRVRLEPAVQPERKPAVMVSFDLHNTGLDNLTDLVVEIALSEAKAKDTTMPPAVLVGPLVVKAKTLLLPDHSIEYQLLLQGVSSACDCVPTVRIRSARVTLEPPSPD